MLESIALAALCALAGWLILWLVGKPETDHHKLMRQYYIKRLKLGHEDDVK